MIAGFVGKENGFSALPGNTFRGGNVLQYG